MSDTASCSYKRGVRTGNDPLYFPGHPMMILAQTTSELTDCVGKFEWSKDDTARILALNILVLTDQASRSAHFIGQQGLWKTFIEQDESAANLAMRNEQYNREQTIRKQRSGVVQFKTV